MKKTKAIELKADDLQKAWDSGCSDRREALENLYPDFFENDDTYQCGDIISANNRDKYIMAAIGHNKYALINLKSGWRLSNPFDVKDSDNITVTEMNANACTKSTFKKIKS